MVPPKKNPSTAIMSNGSTKPHNKFGGGKDDGSGSGDVSYKKESGNSRKENRSQNTSGSFRTDTAISGNRAMGERTLQPWIPEDAPTSQDLSLEGTSTGGQWDQFAANEQKFGLRTDYDPDIYTTTINKNDPKYQERYERAGKIARDIEKGAASNSHVAEERITDNFAGEAGVTEEDRYSGVRRQQDFPPLASANRSDKYTPPARRPPTSQSTVSGAPVDSAIISSKFADRIPTDKSRSTTTSAQAVPKADMPASKPNLPATNAAAAAAAKAETKATTDAASGSATTAGPAQDKKFEISTSMTAAVDAVNTASNHGTTAAIPPNATANIERDLSNHFKSFATQQRSQIDRTRKDKAKQDKETKLNELKKFAQSFKLHSVVPNDLIPIIAKDPKKQKEIRERSKREAEVKAQGDTAAKVVVPVAPASDLKTSKSAVSQAAPAANIATNRQHSGRAQGFAQGAFPQQNRNHQGPVNSNQHQHGRQNNGGSLNAKVRSLENSKYGPPPVFDPRMSLVGQARLPPTGPAMPNGDSRRSSGHAFPPKLNPNTAEFRPTTTSFPGTNANPSVTSSPRSGGPGAQPPKAKKTFLRVKLLPASERPSFIKSADIFEHLQRIPPKDGKDYSFNAGIIPPYETTAVFKSDPPEIPPDKKAMVESFTKLFEVSTASVLPMSPAQTPHATPQVAHQHQLPFHLQHGAQHGMGPRPSPRQHPMQVPHQYQQGQPIPYNGHDDHRMVPSHSQQSFHSPRLGNVPMNVYAAPMPQNAQMAHGFQPGMPFPMAGGPAPNLNRSYSGSNGPFYPQSGAIMAGPPVMMQNPVNGYMGPHMVPQQMPMHPPGPYYMQQPGPGNGPGPMAGANGYPSPGRGGAPMMNQGSQQGQAAPPVYGLSPSMQFNQPVPGPGPYPGQQPGPMGAMRGGGFGPGQSFGTSPQQIYHMNQQNRGPGGPYNSHNGKNYHPPHHTPAQQHQVPTGPQSRPGEAVEEAK